MLKVLGAVFPHFCPNKREIWHRGADLPFAPPTKFHVYRGNVSPLRGEKPIFGPLSKNNTRMAAEEGPGRAAALLSSLLAVPNATAHPSTASVPTSYYSMWHYNSLCPLKG